MRSRFTFVFQLALLLPVTWQAAAQAAVIYNEAASGDLSNNQNAPTALTLGLGTNSVIGNANGTGGDSQDWLALTVPAGIQLNSDVLAAYSSTDAQGFTGFAVGATFPNSPFSAGSYAGYSHFGTGAANNGQPALNLVGADLLPLMANNAPTGTAPGATGFTIPLGPGTYSFLIQQLGASTSYQFDFDTTASVPEPASLSLLAVTGLLALRRSRR